MTPYWSYNLKEMTHFLKYETDHCSSELQIDLEQFSHPAVNKKNCLTDFGVCKGLDCKTGNFLVAEKNRSSYLKKFQADSLVANAAVAAEISQGLSKL